MSEAAPPLAQAAAGPPSHALELVLRLCAAEDPRPWHPRVYARTAGKPPDLFYYWLENLWLDGLVQKAEGTPETGPGVTLTPLGREVLDDPAALQRLREGRPVVEGSRGGIVREAVRRPPRPTVTYGLVGVGLAVFAYGLLLAVSGGGGAAAYLIPTGRLPLGIYEKLGALFQGGALVRGEWSRLATTCFVHIGVLNLVFALFYLYRVGARVEQMWGAWRVLLIFLFAGAGGNCLSVGLRPGFVMPGSWGAVYGLLGATAVWVVCNDRCLPRAVVRRMRTNVAVDAAMLLLFFVVYPVDRWEEIGGAGVGAAVALVFQAQRFGPSPWRWAALAALVPLPWLGYTFVRHEIATNPEWIPIIQGINGQADAEADERKAFQDAFVKRVNTETNRAYNFYLNEGGVLDLAPAERKPADVDRVKAHLAERRGDMKTLAADLAAAGPYTAEAVINARTAAFRYVETLDDLLITAEKRLREGAEWTEADESKAQKVKDAADAWFKLLK